MKKDRTKYFREYRKRKKEYLRELDRIKDDDDDDLDLWDDENE